MPTTTVKCAAVFAAIGDTLRLSILSEIGIEGASFKAIVDPISQEFDVSESVVRHHVSVLTSTGVITCLSLGRDKVYQIDFEVVGAAVTTFEALVGLRARGPAQKV
jgi:DNA-binding transcriptional ArsR family regulator